VLCITLLAYTHLISVTWRDILPSATRILPPTLTEVGRDLYERAKYSGVHGLA
jgi:hypothetical protein